MLGKRIVGAVQKARSKLFHGLFGKSGIGKSGLLWIDSLFFLIGWLIWKERNARTFNGEATTPMQLCSLIQDEVDSWSLAGYRHLMSLMVLV
jgi:hypothetical protein